MRSEEFRAEVEELTVCLRPRDCTPPRQHRARRGARDSQERLRWTPTLVVAQST
jgi:hypothetical protein